MTDGTFMDRLRSFLGLKRETPRNDFRNPIWGSDDEDDGDELYSRQQMDVFTETMDLHQEFSRQMQEIFKSFGNMFGDMKSFHDEEFENFPTFPQTEPPVEGNTYSGGTRSLRDYYLKPGYHRKETPKEDIDLDGKISSNEISGLLKQKDDDHNSGQIVPFNGNMVPGRSFCQTIITTSVTKPDGTVETRRIVKNGNEVIEETTTTSPDSKGPMLPGADPTMGTNLIYNSIMSELSSLFRNFY